MILHELVGCPAVFPPGDYRCVTQPSGSTAIIGPGIDLATADLSSTDLAKADLRGADLRHANLSGADLGGARLDGADLRDAVVEGANLVAAITTNTTRCPEGGAGPCTFSDDVGDAGGDAGTGTDPNDAAMKKCMHVALSYQSLECAQCACAIDPEPITACDYDCWVRFHCLATHCSGLSGAELNSCASTYCWYNDASITEVAAARPAATACLEECHPPCQVSERAVPHSLSDTAEACCTTEADRDALLADGLGVCGVRLANDDRGCYELRRYGTVTDSCRDVMTGTERLVGCCINTEGLCGGYTQELGCRITESSAPAHDGTCGTAAGN